MQTNQRRLLRPVRPRAMQRYRAPHQPPACDLWARISDAVRDLNAGTIGIAAFSEVVKASLLRSAELTVAREISLPDAERINRLGALALRQAQRIAGVGSGAPDDPSMRAPGGEPAVHS